MVGLLIAMTSGRSSDDHFKRAFSEPLEDIPKAPGNGMVKLDTKPAAQLIKKFEYSGLILEQVHYHAYNKKNGHLHSGGLDWEACAEKANDFKISKILPVLYR